MAFAYFQCNDGGAYFVWRDITPDGSGHVAWFGYHPSGVWAHVFRGHWIVDGPSHTGLRGDWCDVPLGSTTGVGSLSIARQVSDTQIETWTRTDQTGGFGGSTWHETGPKPLPPLLPIRRDFPPSLLSGVWTTDRGDLYYVRELPTIGGSAPVRWFAARSDATAGHVAFGNRYGNHVTVDWFAVPPAQTPVSGSLHLEILADREMVKQRSTPDIEPVRWMRVS